MYKDELQGGRGGGGVGVTHILFLSFSRTHTKLLVFKNVDIFTLGIFENIIDSFPMTSYTLYGFEKNL